MNGRDGEFDLFPSDYVESTLGAHEHPFDGFGAWQIPDFAQDSGIKPEPSSPPLTSYTLQSTPLDQMEFDAPQPVQSPTPAFASQQPGLRVTEIKQEPSELNHRVEQQHAMLFAPTAAAKKSGRKKSKVIKEMKEEQAASEKDFELAQLPETEEWTTLYPDKFETPDVVGYFLK